MILPPNFTPSVTLPRTLRGALLAVVKFSLPPCGVRGVDLLNRVLKYLWEMQLQKAPVSISMRRVRLFICPATYAFSPPGIAQNLVYAPDFSGPVPLLGVWGVQADTTTTGEMAGIAALITKHIRSSTIPVGVVPAALVT